MITKDDLITIYKREIELTIKVLKAVPEDQLEYRPHERSSSVKDILRTFIAIMEMDKEFVQGREPKDSMKKVPEFDFITEGIASFDSATKSFLEIAEKVPAEEYSQAMKMLGMDTTRVEMLYMMLNDMIHHRGQLSVYVRLAGGKVPAIYGKSADDNGGF